jgi:DNA integrity scanning protein DisA with diadenylate cyclase activity
MEILIAKIKQWWREHGRAYWTAVGVIPRWQLLAVYAAVSVVFVVAVVRGQQASNSANRAAMSARALAIRVDSEAKSRVNESCTMAETRYRGAITNLESTYTYIGLLTSEERKQTLNQFIVKALPKQEADLKLLKPAKFCSAKGVGLPGPDPKPPVRPPSLPTR